MTSRLSAMGKNAALDGVGAVVNWLSIHDTKTPVDASSEPTGGSPAYARKQVVWDKAQGGIIAVHGAYAWDVPPGFTVRAVGFWSEESGGIFYGYFEVNDETYSGQGVHTLTSGKLSLNEQ